MEAAERALLLKSDKVLRSMRLYDPAHLSEVDLERHSVKMDAFDAMAEEYFYGVRDLILQYESATMTSQKKEEWENSIVTMEKKVIEYTKEMKAKVAEVRRVSRSETSESIALNNSSHQEDLLATHRKRNEIAEKCEAERNTEREVKKKAAIAKAKKKREVIFEEGDLLEELVNKVNYWSHASDLAVGRAMRELKDWLDGLQNVKEMNRCLQETLDDHDLTVTQADCGDVERYVDQLALEVTKAIDDVKAEDNDRELYTLDASKTDTVKLPIFEGKEDEDFAQFKVEIQRAFIQNRISKADKLAKLREVLRGHAKKLVPESTINTIQEAWEALDNAFNNPGRLMRARKEKLAKLGPFPSENSKGGFQAQAEWYMEAEALLRSMIDLGKKDEAMKMEIFAESTIDGIIKLFPKPVFKLLNKCSGQCQERLENILTKMSELRAEVQKNKLTADAPPLVASAVVGGGGGGGSAGYVGQDDDGIGQKVGRRVKISGINLQPPNILKVYPHPKREESCRVCKALEEKGDTLQLYDMHFSNYVTGCPRYIAFSVEERLEIAILAKLCLRCYDPEYVWKGRDKSHKCPVQDNFSKIRYSCNNVRCLSHSWSCVRHRTENIPKLNKFQEEIHRKHGLSFGFVVSYPIGLHSIPEVKKSHASTQRTHSPVAGVKETKSGLKSPLKKSQVIRKKNKPGKSIFNQAKPGKSVFDQSKENLKTSVDTVAATSDNAKQMSEEQALDKLKRKLSSSGVKEVLRPIAKGRSQFMLGVTKGKSRGLLNLYDTGCGGVLFREGVQNELGPAVLRAKGPFCVNGVGDTTVQVNDLWMLSQSLLDGTRQCLEGWTVDKITSTLPWINLSQAVAEVKEDKKDNRELQSLMCPPRIGGDCDILMGIQYSSLFPVAIHSLESGLTIYKMLATPQDKRYNCVIGGPHESFAMMNAQFGGVGLVFANLCRQIENYQKFGPPKLGRVLMTQEDIKYAEGMKEWEIENFDHVVDEFFENYEEESDGVSVLLVSDKHEGDDNTGNNVKVKDIEIAKSVMDCSLCGRSLSEQCVDVMEAVFDAVPTDIEPLDEDDLPLKVLKRLAQQEGINIEYRCPKCRSCNDCRRSFATERVSLREEAEDMMIWDSVDLDWENKRIICSLPLRGEEEEFLSNNRDIALRILNQQCQKYFKDEDTKTVIVKAFDKLIKNNQMVRFKDLSEEERAVIESKQVNHYIPWRVVFKPSLSTPARPVFDASSNTRHREDGSGGRCLNDAVVKGRVVTLNLIKMVLRFTVGKFAVQGDLKQFYASIKLVVDNWNLQRILYREDLDPNGEVVEAIIKTLIWGVKCVSAQSECAIIKLAEAIKEEFPALADFLLNSRFVDDLGGSSVDLETLKKLVSDADRFFAMIGLACKGWTFTGSDPPEDVSEEGQYVSIGGMKWFSMLDLLEVPLPMLHFGKKARGRLAVGTEVFSGSMLTDMDKFVPKKLTRRQIVSKNSSVFDLPGKYVPVMTGLKKDMREAVLQTEGWDDAVPDELRSKWVANFWRLEKLKGLKYQRAIMPEDAVSTKMNLIVSADAADSVKITGVWGRFKRKCGQYSCQLVIGRSLLAEDGTIPKNELDSLMMGSNLGWIVRQALEDWVSDYILIGDSSISLCWVTSEKKRLSLFHRNRCVQIRRGTDLDKLYHVISAENPADLGTRPETVKDDDIGPNSKWEKGLEWMKGEINDAVTKGILTPASELRLNKEEEEDYNKGMVFEKTKEILTRGHPTILITSRVESLKQRAEFSNYLLSPTKFKFEKMIRVYATIWRFVKSFKCLKGRFGRSKVKTGADEKFSMFVTVFGTQKEIGFENENEFENQFRIFAMTPIFTIPENDKDPHVYSVFDKKYMETALDNSDYEIDEKVVDVHRIVAIGFGAKNPGVQFKGKYHVSLTDDDFSKALNYIYRKGSAEVKEFNKPELVKKVSVEKNGILYSRSRILDTHRFKVTGGLENLDSLNLLELGIKGKTPILDRFSPIAYSLADYVHRVLSKHGGYETCMRDCLNHCLILQGLCLFREIGEDCVKCAKMRKQYLDVSMGAIADEQLIIAPAFWVTMCDIFGPCTIYVPGHSMKTRHRNAVDVKCYVLVFLCPTTKLVNLQVIEDKSADGICDGVTRLGCEVGIPSFVLTDQDSGIVKVLKDAEMELRNLELVLYKQKGIRFKTCPVSGHNMHGAVERKIKTVQEALEKSDIKQMRLHAMGLQTFVKLVENDINNVPLGFSYGRNADNSPLLKLIFPNMLKIGRNNSRALSGPVKMPGGTGDLMKKIEKAYSTFFKVWNTTMIPKMLKMNKWYDNGKVQLTVGDIVYFDRAESSELSSKWTLGKIVEVVKSKDGEVRRAQVQYQNFSEDFPRYTDRAVRSLIKLFHMDDQNWQDDMATMEKMVELLQQDEVVAKGYVMLPAGDGLKFRISRLDGTAGSDLLSREVGVQHRPGTKIIKSKFMKPCTTCCCISHCLFSTHGTGSFEVPNMNVQAQFCYPELVDRSVVDDEEFMEEMYDMAMLEQDSFMGLMCAVSTDFDLGEELDFIEE